MKKKNFLSKVWLKYTYKAAYKQYKWDMMNYAQTEFTEYLIGNGKLTNVYKIKAAAEKEGHLNFMHGGNAGDIIYALATIKTIQQITGVPVNLYFHLGKPMYLPMYNKHPLGNVMFNQKMADMLAPLIEQQDYINSVGIYTDQKIHIDLDYFRAGLFSQSRGNIARWCGYITGVSPVLYKNWLRVKPDTTYADTIVIARSGRYQNRSIDYSFLGKYPNLVFLGVESEHKDMQKYLPNIKWQPVDSFLQMAQIIAGSKLFIGNQSFPYAIAEGLKVPRILEVSFEVINVVPEGEHAHDFFFQEHFEWLVEELTNQPPLNLPR